MPSRSARSTWVSFWQADRIRQEIAGIIHEHRNITPQIMAGLLRNAGKFFKIACGTGISGFLGLQHPGGRLNKGLTFL